MIVRNDLLKRVREHFNLNIYETKVWLALLSKGIATAGEIAELSGVPRSRTYDVLEGLEKQGFAIMKLGKPVKYIAVSPGIVIERLKADMLKETDERVDVLGEVKQSDDYNQLELLYKQGIKPVKAEELSGVIKGKRNLYSHLKGLIGNASEQVILATTAQALRKKLRFLKPLCKGLSKKGIKVKIAVNGSEDEIKELSKELKAQIKTTDMKGRFCIVDGKEAMFMLTPDSVPDDSDSGIWLNSGFFAASLNNLFELAWNK